MFKAKVIKNISITESIRQMEPGMTLKFPPTVAYNTIKTAILRLKKKVINSRQNDCQMVVTKS